MSSSPREIILGVGGGIAAYKSCDLLRRLRDANFGVTVVPTPSSLNFVGKATWEALSGRKVTTSVFEDVDEVRHVALAKQARAMIIAPATADLIARIAMGRADDLLTNLVLAAEFPIVVIPAMHPAMWSNPATVANVEILRSRGYFVMEPDTGALTSGDHGKGRFPTTQAILDFFKSTALVPEDLKGKKVLISAGGTREAIDPVRYIGNKSSGKQGIALAEAALRRGASVTLVIANSDLPTHSHINRVDVSTAQEMHSALSERFGDSDYLFMSAAVADARPLQPSQEKIKKERLSSIELTPNIDILAELASQKINQIVVAFAAETADDSHLLAREKMERKGAELIYLNDVSGGAIFGSDMTTGTIISHGGERAITSPISKLALAHELINHAIITANKLG